MSIGHVAVRNLREQELVAGVLRAVRLLQDDLRVGSYTITVKVQGRAIQVSPSWTAHEVILPVGAEHIPPVEL